MFQISKVCINNKFKLIFNLIISRLFLLYEVYQYFSKILISIAFIFYYLYKFFYELKFIYFIFMVAEIHQKDNHHPNL
jgi:hypothetical protein